MLPAMVRTALLAILVVAPAFAGCSKSASSNDKAPAPAAPAPATDTAKTADPAAAPAAVPDDPKKHLQPEEGTLTIDKVDCKAGSEATASIKVTPGAHYHMSTDFPINLKLDAPAGVKLAKAEFNAGKGDKGDASEFSEKSLGFAVKATPEKAGSYEIKGMFKFGVCDDQACHPKRQPVTITIACT